jgi:hypothetical protein
MKMTPEEQQRQQFHDVNRPGHTGPSPTSRPVIVGHHPAMPDPMVNHRPVHHQPQAPVRTPEPSRGGPNIDGFTPPPMPHHLSPHHAPAQPPVQPGGQILAGEPLQSPPFDSTPPHHQAAMSHHSQGLAEDDPLFHGHHQAGEHSQITHSGIASKRSKWWAPLVILILLLIALYLAIDSGLINSNINLPFHLFPQAEPPVYTPYFR